MPTPDPNHRLRAARERTPSRRTLGIAMSREELADAVALWCAQHDPQHRAVAFDATHLSKIERGVVRRPRPHYLAALCAILGATETDLGFGPQSPSLISPASGWDRGSVAAAVERTTGEDLATTRRQAILAVTLAGTTLTAPLQHWLDPLPDSPAPECGNAYTPPEVEALEAMVTQLRGWNRAGTGVLARKAVIAQFAQASDRVRDAPAGPLTTRGTVATARLATLAASMAWDAGAHRGAQRYFVLAVQLAKLAPSSAHGHG